MLDLSLDAARAVQPEGCDEGAACTGCRPIPAALGQVLCLAVAQTPGASFLDGGGCGFQLYKAMSGIDDDVSFHLAVLSPQLCTE